MSSIAQIKPAAVQQAATEDPGAIMEQVIALGDLSRLSPEQRARYYTEVCRSVGLNPLTKPFDYITLNGKLTLYPTRGAADQLRAIHRITCEIVSREQVGDLIVVHVRVTAPDGRRDEDLGIVSTAGLRGDALANAILKAICVPLDSEILTRDGFKRYDEVRIGEEVLAYDVERDCTVWTPLRNVTVHDALPVATLATSGGRFRVRCTPDHSWPVERSPYRPRLVDGSRGLRGPYANRQPARALIPANRIHAGHRLILSAPVELDEASLLTPVEAAILGWAVTDGTIKRVGNSVRLGICQSKEENFEPIRELVAAGAGEVREIVNPARTRTFPNGRTYDGMEQHWWYLPAAISKAILDRAGFCDRSDLPRIVTRLDSAARKAMLQAFMLAEGDRRGHFHNGDPAVLEAFQILATLEGYALSRPQPNNSIQKIRLRKRRRISGQNLTLTLEGSEPVWCPTTDYGTWVMRQGGHVVITGNTKAKRRATLSLLGLNMPDETEVETIPSARPVRVDVETGEILDAPVAETPAEHQEHPAPESTGGRQPSREMRALHAAAAGKAEHEDLSRLAAAIYGVPSMRALSPAQLAQLRAAVAECADAEAFAQLAGLAAAIDGAVSEEGLMAVATEVGKAGLGNGARVVLLREAFRRVREALAAQPAGMPEDDAGEPDQQQPALATEDACDANDEPVSWTALWRAFEPLGIRSLADAAAALGVPQRELRDLTPAEVRRRLIEVARS